MSHGLLLDITQIPTQLAGLAGLTKAMAVAMLTFIIPWTIFEMNISGMRAREYPDYSGFFVRAFGALLALVCYQRIFSFITKIARMMSYAVLSEEQWGDFLVQSFHGVGTGVPTLNILLHPISSIQEIILFLSSLVAVTARDVIIMLQGCFLSLLFAFGPIAIVCAINRRTSQVTRGWLANTFQVAFWSFFLRLVVRVWLTLNPIAGNLGAGAANDYLGILTVNVTFLLMVLGTPVVAARLLSGENLAMIGAAALTTVQAVLVTKKMGAGAFFSREVERYRKAEPEDRKSHTQFPLRALAFHTIPTTATSAYRKLFPPKGNVGNKETRA
ncbi:MAG: hypothetical protein PHF00_10070 [Elusimicrobia bacterium]|nr:hypothetical protein [Elusimicrobiota bacterium]